MKRLLFFLALSSLCISIHSQSQTKSDLVEQLDALITPLVSSNNYSGTTLIQRGDELLYHRAFGFENREHEIRTRTDTKFFLASISMVFTSAAIMNLVDDGKINVDDPVSKFIPAYRHGDSMTIRHLLTERAGIPAPGANGNINYTEMTESPQTIDQLIDYFKDYDLEWKPGTAYRHTRSSYILLAKIIEVASGQSFGSYLEQAIFKPLGMNNSGHFGQDAGRDDFDKLSMGYVPIDYTDLEIAQQLHWSSKTGHASIFSTTGDLLLFSKAMKENKLLSEKSWKETFTPHFGDNNGYGWFLGEVEGRPKISMSGGSPGYSSFIVIFPEEELTIIMLSNINIYIPYYNVYKLAAIVRGEPYEKLNLTNPILEKADIQDMIGRYQFGEDFYRTNGVVSITFENGTLFADGNHLIPVDEGSASYTRFINRRYWSNLEFVDKNTLYFDSYKGMKIE